MKVHINYRALCPYTTNAKGEDVYHWYTEDIETSEIRIGTGGFIQINKGGVEWSCFEAEQIHLMTIKQ